MGAERWLRLASLKEADKLKQVLPNDMDIGIEGDFGCWITWHKPTVIWIGYSDFKGWMFANMIAKEIALRFKIRSVGVDGVGWFKNSELTVENSQYKNWVEWMKGFSIHRHRFSNVMGPEYLSAFSEKAERILHSIFASTPVI